MKTAFILIAVCAALAMIAPSVIGAVHAIAHAGNAIVTAANQ